LDVPKAQVTACVRVPDESGVRVAHVAEFKTTVGGLLVLRDWLKAHVRIGALTAVVIAIAGCGDSDNGKGGGTTARSGPVSKEDAAASVYQALEKAGVPEAVLHGDRESRVAPEYRVICSGGEADPKAFTCEVRYNGTAGKAFVLTAVWCDHGPQSCKLAKDVYGEVQRQLRAEP